MIRVAVAPTIVFLALVEPPSLLTVYLPLTAFFVIQNRHNQLRPARWNELDVVRYLGIDQPASWCTLTEELPSS